MNEHLVATKVLNFNAFLQRKEYRYGELVVLETVDFCILSYLYGKVD
jgi:hypothetical protein